VTVDSAWIFTGVYPFAVFGLPVTADDEAFSAAYAQLLSRFPPESGSSQYDDIQQAWSLVRTMEDRARTWVRWALDDESGDPTPRTKQWLLYHSRRRPDVEELVRHMRNELLR
jgi:hypothetical protein